MAKATVDTMRGHNENSRVRRYGCFILGTLSYQNYVGNQVMPAISVAMTALHYSLGCARRHSAVETYASAS